MSVAVASVRAEQAKPTMRPSVWTRIAAQCDNKPIIHLITVDAWPCLDIPRLNLNPPITRVSRVAVG